MNRGNAPNNEYAPVIPMQTSSPNSPTMRHGRGGMMATRGGTVAIHNTAWVSPAVVAPQQQQQQQPPISQLQLHHYQQHLPQHMLMHRNHTGDHLHTQFDDTTMMDSNSQHLQKQQQQQQQSSTSYHTSQQQQQQMHQQQQRSSGFFQTTTTPTFSHSSHYTNYFLVNAAEKNVLKRRDAPDMHAPNTNSTSALNHHNNSSNNNNHNAMINSVQQESSEQFKRRKLIAIMNSMSLSSEEEKGSPMSSPSVVRMTHGSTNNNHNNNVEVEMSDVDAFRPYQIFIRTPCSKSFILETNEQEFISDLKFKIEHKLGIPHALMYLECGGKILYDNKVCSDFNIQKDSTVTVHVRGTSLKPIPYPRN